MFDFIKTARTHGVPAAAPKTLTRDDIAGILRISPEVLSAFEDSYRTEMLSDEMPTGNNFFDVNARQAKKNLDAIGLTAYAHDLNSRIIRELVAQTPVMHVTRDGQVEITPAPENAPEPAVTLDDIMAVPENIRPQLSGRLAKKDMHGTDGTLLGLWKDWHDPSKSKLSRQTAKNHFRQGLDILDLEPLAYAMLGTNPNAIGNWLPGLANAVSGQDFFKLPETRVIRVPMTLLQLTRVQYEELTTGTFDVLNRYCMEVFGLNPFAEYFVKTGTYSSKFDFRNAHVHGEQEVRELGQYLLYIQYQAQQMAGPLSEPNVYGVSTTNEWAVRKYIKPAEHAPCIYKGMPLRTEYRVFVDFDANEILGVSPYWKPDVMKARFSRSQDNPDDTHDYIIYAAVEPDLMARYESNHKTVTDRLHAMLPDFGMTGQWSVDVMQEGGDFYVIDMALAANSALADCVPKGLIRPIEENWLPAVHGTGLALGPWA